MTWGQVLRSLGPSPLAGRRRGHRAPGSQPQLWAGSRDSWGLSRTPGPSAAPHHGQKLPGECQGPDIPPSPRRDAPLINVPPNPLQLLGLQAQSSSPLTPLPPTAGCIPGHSAGAPRRGFRGESKPSASVSLSCVGMHCWSRRCGYYREYGSGTLGASEVKGHLAGG